MERSIGLQTLASTPTLEHSHTNLWKLRLALGWTILLAALVGLFALSWDIQWHIAVGRDRTLTMPHLFILGHIAVTGLAALAAVLIETQWARRNPAIARKGTLFANIFSSSPGAYLVGYGALTSAIAFPVDQYWHTLYGIDVSIWAPFHIMAIVGFCVTCLGLAEMMGSGAHLAQQQGAKFAARTSYIGLAIALAILMGLLSVLLPNALGRSGFIKVGNLAFTVFPLMLGAFAMFVFTIATRTLPSYAPATSVALTYIVLGLLNFPLIPQAMTWLLGIEQQNLRSRAPALPALGIQWQYGLIVAAILLDIALLMMRRQRRSLPKASRMLLIAGLIGMSAATLLYPSFLAAIVRLHYSVILTIVVSLLLGLFGTYAGYWLGTGFGELMQGKEIAEQ